MTPKETYEAAIAAIEHTYNEAIKAAVVKRDHATADAVKAYQAALLADGEGSI